jgi:hypothetical protein
MISEHKMKIKVFTKVGLMKGEKWIKGVLLEEYPNIFLVETHGNKISVEKRFVKPIVELKHDEKGLYPALEEFVENNWEELKSYVVDSMKHFFPQVEFSIKEDEKVIECESFGLSIAASVKEIETISCFKEIPVWEVLAFNSIPATRDEPEDYSETTVSSEPGNLTTAKIFIDYIWSSNTIEYWEKYSIY